MNFVQYTSRNQSILTIGYADLIEFCGIWKSIPKVRKVQPKRPQGDFVNRH